ncbi:MAG: hypothetical protein GX610_01120, partial [Rhodococcus sp.]|nr:hypothetical protein [Rhodococcus sp. (in: high G+C Gram-positive bacteria)]
LARYALILAALSLASLFLILRLDQNGAYLTTTLLANWVLGCAFFIGFGLISQNRIGMVTKFAAVALVVHLLNLTTNVGFLVQGATEASSYLLACLVFTFFLLSVARSALCEIRNYSYDLHLSRSTHVLQGGGVQG